ncbi:class I SAM-dependent methyltransferase [Oceanospirillum sanctuarii]|uniref:class I SAM-dependent methyltransferase n=1 Tax=Oceanospirillum sanctuarii TaxID=1434821 RepID=UPI003183ED03
MQVIKPEQIGKAYDQITHLWQKAEFNRNNGIEAHERAIKIVRSPAVENPAKAQVESEAETGSEGEAINKSVSKALDIGCGCTGRFADLLQSGGFQVSGLDVSAEMIKLAQERNPDVTFIEGDICEVALPERYDLITAWDSIWHLPLDQQKPVLSKIVDHLNPGGVFIFSFGGTAEASDHVDDFMGPEVYYSTLGTEGFIALFLELGCRIRHLEYDQYPELHTYLIIQKP